MDNQIKIAVVNINGNIDYINVGSENYFHSVLLNDYITKNYIVNENDNVNMSNANSMSLFLREKGNIVFLNSTTYKNGRPDIHGVNGIVIFPNEITNLQKESLVELNEKLKDYDVLQVWYDFESHESCRMLFTKDKKQVHTILDYVADKINLVKTK